MILRACRGDQASWETLVDVYGPLFFSFCRKRGLQSADAADVTQEVFKQLRRSLPQYDCNRGRFRTWLWAILRSKITRVLRQAGRAGCGVGGALTQDLLAGLSTDGEADWEGTAAAYIYQKAKERVRAEVRDDTWQIFERVWERDEPMEAVAMEIGRPLSQVRDAKRRVLQRLKEEVLELMEEVPFRSRPPANR